MLRVAALVAIGLLIVSCVGDSEREPMPEEVNAYFAEMTTTLAQAYARSEGLVRILDDASYAETLSVNTRRFADGAASLQEIDAPPRFADEHAEYVAAFRDIADALQRDLDRINAGEDVTDVLVSQLEGPLAGASARQEAACHAILAQAEVYGVYDGLACGGDPYFIVGAEPDWAERVFVNRCCGGSHPLSNPLDIFYGSGEPWQRTRTHYEAEMRKRGFVVRPGRDGRTLVFSKPDKPDECFSIAEFRDDDLPIAVEAHDVADLDEFPYAYVTGYTRICGG